MIIKYPTAIITIGESHVKEAAILIHVNAIY